MPTIQRDYNERTQPDWIDQKVRQRRREQSWQVRCDYLEGKLEVLSAFTLSLVRLISPSIDVPSVGKTTDIEASNKEPVVNPVNLVLDTLSIEPPGAPPQDEHAAQFADGWDEMLRTLKRELHG